MGAFLQERRNAFLFKKRFCEGRESVREIIKLAIQKCFKKSSPQK